MKTIRIWTLKIIERRLENSISVYKGKRHGGKELDFFLNITSESTARNNEWKLQGYWL